MFSNSSTYLKAIESIASELSVASGTILVTGATGLIGTCMIDVLSMANRSFGKKFKIYAISRSKEKLENRFGSNQDVYCIPQSVTTPINIKGLDYIVHAASNADPNSYALYPVETILTNVVGAQNVLDYCKNNKTRALLTSTFEVYGKLKKDEYAERDYGVVDLNRIRSSYPESKRTAELLFRAYCEEYKVNCVIARLSSVYGPTMQSDDSKAHAQFIRNALLGEGIILKSDGTQKRTYCYVIDAVSGLFKVLFNGIKGEIYNVANDQSVATIAEVAQIISKLTGIKIAYKTPNEIEQKGFSEPKNCILLTEKLKSLGWSGRYDLRAGMEETIKILHELERG